MENNLQKEILELKLKLTEKEAALEKEKEIAEKLKDTKDSELSMQNDVCSNMANLASTYSTLADIDPELLDRQEKQKLNTVKDKVMQSLLYCGDRLRVVKMTSD